MKVLVGIPVFRIGGLVQLCLASLVCTPATVLAVDNAADADVKQVLKTFGSSYVKAIVNEENRYCNGGWNQIMKYGLDNGFDVVALGSSDAVLHKGWYDAVLKRMREHNNEILFPSIGRGVVCPNTENVLINPT